MLKLSLACHNARFGPVRTRAFEGHFEKEDFVAHDGDRRAASKSDVFKLGEAWQHDDKVWAYYTAEHKYLNSGKVTAVGTEKPACDLGNLLFLQQEMMSANVFELLRSLHISSKIQKINFILAPVSTRKSYVEFDDGDKGLLPNGWIHKIVKFESSSSNEAECNNNESNDNAAA